MQLIKSLAEIDYKVSKTLNFLATVISVDSEGDSERKKPFRATLKLEESGELTSICSWSFENLQTFKDLVLTDDVYQFEGIPSLYKDTEKQIRIGNIRPANMKSTKKIVKSANVDDIKAGITNLIETYISKTGPYSVYRDIIDKLVMNNPKFWTWPAATKIHHAYPGGLAKHTLNTAKNAVAIWQTYQGENLNIALIVAGAILHDIGKISEYNADGSRTVYGNLIPHPVAGYSKVFNVVKELGLDPEKSTQVVMLLHTILTHHEKLEYGASTQPNILEALIIARSDMLDANFETVTEAINTVEVNTSTEKLMPLDYMSFFKWHN